MDKKCCKDCEYMAIAANALTRYCVERNARIENEKAASEESSPSTTTTVYQENIGKVNIERGNCCEVTFTTT